MAQQTPPPSARRALHANYEARLRSPGTSYRPSPRRSSRSGGVTSPLRSKQGSIISGRKVDSPGSNLYSDRFIPSRSGSHFGAGMSPTVTRRASTGSTASGSGANVGESGSKEGNSTYSALLKNELLGLESPVRSSPETKSPNIFRFKSARLSLREELANSYSLSPIGHSSHHLLSSPKISKRKIAKAPFKVLDAPSLQDDFYLNLVDWSALNVLAVGLGSCVYLWSACTSKVTKLCDLGSNDCITSVAWTQRGLHLAVGTNNGEVQIWDSSKCRKIRTMRGHSARVGTMAWNSQSLASGSRDRSIYQRDVRVPNDFTRKLVGHKQEVCGLRWSFDDQQLASGGNDNKLLIWNASSTTPVLRFTDHTAAVKAIAWSPHQHGLLASGGGTADRCIRFWNTLAGTPLSCIDTGSQVCNLTWSKNVNEVLSTHGYSLNQIIVWRYPSMSKVVTLTGHTFRVLYLAMSPDGQTVVTGAGDETLRFWNIFPGPKNKDGSRLGPGLLFPCGADIR